jgi:glucose/arabinose dehydrogenase
MHGSSRAGKRIRALGGVCAVGCLLAIGSAPALGATKASIARTRLSPTTLVVPGANGASPFNSNHKLSVPSGWGAEVWARVSNARFAVWTPQDHLLVSSSSAGQIVELTPGAGGGAATQRTLISGLTSPQGLAFDSLEGSEVLYVAESNQVDRYVWGAGGTLGARTVLIRGLPDQSKGDDVHHVKSLAIGPDHTIYVSVGSASNASPLEPAESPPRASILAYHPDASHMQVFASGVRNGEGLSFAPDGSLWTAVNERDEVAYPFHRAYGGFADAYGQVIGEYVNEHPPDEVARLSAGRNLGWPYCNPDPDVKPGDPKSKFRYANMAFDVDVQTNASGSALNCSALAPIELGIPAHSAPLGLSFLQGSAVKGRFSRGAVLAVHGSWDRTPPRAPAVLWMPWKKSKSTLGEATALIEGFQEASGSRWGRPADAVAGPDGSLYVTDDTAGAVYRVGPSVGK